MLAEEQAMEKGRSSRLHADGTSPDAASLDAPRAPPGKAGLALVRHCSMAEWLEGLRASQAQLEAEREAVRAGLEIAISKARLEDRRLEEQRVNQLHELTTLRDYEHKIASKLLQLPPELREPDVAASSVPPSASTRSPKVGGDGDIRDLLAGSSPAGSEFTAGSPTEARAASEAATSRVPSGESTWGDVVHSTARSASPTIATPYRRSYLNLEKFTSSTSPVDADGTAADEAISKQPQSAGDDDGATTLQALRRRVSSAILG